MSWRPHLRSQIIIFGICTMLFSCWEDAPEQPETKLEDVASTSIKESLETIVSEKKTVVDSTGQVKEVPKTKKELAKTEQLKQKIAKSDYSKMSDTELKENLGTSDLLLH